MTKKGTAVSPTTLFRRSCLTLGVILTGITLFSACASRQRVIPPPVTGPGWDMPQKETYSIEDYQGSESDEEIPRWVNRYLEGGIAGLEAMNEFAGTYVFVAENSGTNFNALTQWVLRFSPDQDIAQLVARRVQARFPGSDTGSPDHDYGRYFENLVRSAADVFYEGAERKGDFWFQRKYPTGDSENPEEEETYVFLVLLTIDQTALETQLEPVLATAIDGIQTTRDQSSAINRLRASFFDGF
jgi:hypothetical protein